MSDFVRKQVELTSEIIDFFQGVHEMVETEEDVAMIPSDDLLQTERIYGGLTDQRHKIYDFTWFPESSPDERWEMRLFADEIDEIASGYRKVQFVKAYKR